MIKKRIIKVFDWCLRIVSYTIVLMLMTLIFKNTLYIDNSFYGIWCLVASLLIYLLNKTIKPFLIWLTIPITGITLGLFYPFVNLIILKIVSLILGDHFIIYGVWYALFVAICISVINVVLDMTVFKSLTFKEDNDESNN
ncbi:MAG: phage holin family protein [Bacilli bacterium]|nr:phage holin family protein [Bacilli bacterium]